MMRMTIAALLASAATLTAVPALAQSVTGDCASTCSITLTPAQLLQQAEWSVKQRQFDAARPLIDALAAVPQYDLQRHFLAGYIAVETGQLDDAIAHFRAALVGHPKDTRTRLELARALMLRGKDGAADYNFRLAAQADDLPPEIIATIKSSRNLLRDRRPWHLTVEAGIAPDTNITGGTSAETIDVTFGNQVLPFTLEGNARKRSGLGQTLGVSAGYRFKFGDRLSLITDVDGQGTNYEGESADDYTGQLAVGPELKLTDDLLISLQGIGSQRYYGGNRAATQFGARGQVQYMLDRGQRAGLTVDARHTASGFSPDYSGWTYGVYASYERVMLRSFIASASVFGRTDRLAAPYYSNWEYGVNLGLGGELGHGVNAGISGGASRATYDAPLLAFGPDSRKDWRISGRLYAGLRSIRVLGLSPSVSLSYSRNASNIALYDTSRTRALFNLAKYF